MADDYCDIIDVKEFLVNLKEKEICVDEISDFLSELDKMVIYHASNKDGTRLIGLGIYMPYFTKKIDDEGKVITAEAYKTYMNWHVFPSYENYLKRYMSRMENADAIVLADYLENIHVVVEGEGENQKRYLVATIIDTDSFLSSLYSISVATVCNGWNSDGEEKEIMTSSDIVEGCKNKITGNELRIDVTGTEGYTFEGQIVECCYSNGLKMNFFHAYIDDRLSYVYFDDKGVINAFVFLDTFETVSEDSDKWEDYGYKGNHYIQIDQSQMTDYDEVGISYFTKDLLSEKMLFSKDAKVQTNSNVGYSLILDPKSAHIFEDSDDLGIKFCTKLTDDCKINPTEYKNTDKLCPNNSKLVELITDESRSEDNDDAPMIIDLDFKNDYYFYKFLDRRSYLNTSAWSQFVDNSDGNEKNNNYSGKDINLDKDDYLTADEDELNVKVYYYALPNTYLPTIKIDGNDYVLPVSSKDGSIKMMLSDADSDSGYEVTISVKDYEVTGITFNGDTYGTDEYGYVNEFTEMLKKLYDYDEINEITIYNSDNKPCNIGLTKGNWDFCFDKTNIIFDKRIGYSLFLSDYHSNDDNVIVIFDDYDISVTGPSKLLTFGLFSRFYRNSSSDAATSASSGDSSDAATSASSGASSDTASSASSGSSSGKTGASVEDSSSGASSSAGAEASTGKETKTLSNIASTGSDIETPQLESDAA